MKTCTDSKENVIKKMQERTLKQSENLKSTIPLLSASIQKFENTPKNLYSTFQLKKKANQNKWDNWVKIFNLIYLILFFILSQKNHHRAKQEFPAALGTLVFIPRTASDNITKLMK